MDMHLPRHAPTPVPPSSPAIDDVAGSFARRLRDAMRKAGVTQLELSQRVDLDQSTISRYVRGLYEPNIRQLRALAHALGVKSADLLPDD